ncbi:MAG: hypothetical protein JSS20_19875 [Proteobacteria bacterium]|nr:hypothetical protein [Pseudomonadota bacterium]
MGFLFDLLRRVSISEQRIILACLLLMILLGGVWLLASEIPENETFGIDRHLLALLRTGPDFRDAAGPLWSR